MSKQSNTQKAIKGISSQTLVTIVLGVVEIVSFSIMSRLLTQADFGYYAAINAITLVFAAFSETGIGSALIQKKDLDDKYINNAFSLSLVFGSFLSLLLFVLSGPLAKIVADESMTVPLMLMSITLLCNCLASVFRSILHRKLQFFVLGAINLVSSVVTTIIAVVLAYNGFGYYAIIAKAMIGSIISLILSFVLCHTKFRFEFDKDSFKGIFSFSSWLMASSVFRNLAHQIDRLSMSNLLSVTSLGAYNRPKEFINQMSTRLNGIFDTALFPVLSGIQDDVNRLRNSYKKSLYLINVFAILLSLTFVINSELIIRIFFGDNWLNLKNLTQVMSLVLIFNIDGRLADCYLRSLGKTREQFFFRVVETVLNLLAVLIGYHWDIMGVAVSMLISTSSIKIYKILFVTKYMDLSKKESIRIIFSSWKFILFLIPISCIPLILLPHSLGGNIILLLIYTILVAVIFLFIPSIVGTKYKEEIHSVILSYLRVKLSKKY